jgi:hypothetical protein
MAHWGCFTNGKEALSSSWSSRSPFSPPYRSGWFAIVEVRDWSPLAVNEASHGSGEEEVEMPSLLRTISIVGPEWPLRFCLSGINNKVLNRLPCS